MNKKLFLIYELFFMMEYDVMGGFGRVGRQWEGLRSFLVS
jgi:hypothetical protein